MEKLLDSEYELIRKLQFHPELLPEYRDRILRPFEGCEDVLMLTVAPDPAWDDAVALLREAVDDIASTMPRLTEWLRRDDFRRPVFLLEKGDETRVDVCMTNSRLFWHPWGDEGVICVDETLDGILGVAENARDAFTWLLAENRAEILNDDLSMFTRIRDATQTLDMSM